MGYCFFLRKGNVHTAPYVGLPAGYTQLKYVQGTGTQYLDTGVTVNKADTCKLELTADLVSSDNYAGCNGYMQFQAKVGGGTKSEIVVDYANITETVSVNGTQVSTSDWSSYGGTNVKLGLFRLGDTNNGWYSGNPQSGKIYAAKVYKAGVVIREFVPCMTPDDEVGFYDIRNRQFYGNAGTGMFSAGPREELTLPDGYTELDYIQSSGAQYVNTGYVPTANTRIVMDAEIVSHASNGSYFGTRSATSGTDSVSNTLLILSTGGIRSDYYGNSVTSAAYPSGRQIINRNRNVTKIGDASITNTTSNGSSTLPLFLFGTNTAGKLTLPGRIKLYSCQIYDNGTLIRDYWPCRNASGVAGLYDFVGQQFYANAGTGTFLDNLIETVAITVSNIGTYFTVANGTYKFNGSGSVFTSNNNGANSSTASTVLTAKQNIIALTFDYSYSSEANYDKFTLKVGGTTIADGVSGATTNKSYSGSLSSGQKIEFTYAKDSSRHENNDQCTFSNMHITIAKGA